MASSSVDPPLSDAVAQVNHHVGWIDALCKAYRDIPFNVVNALNGSHPMHTMMLRCREPDRPVTDLHAASGRCARIVANAYNGVVVF